MARQNFIGLVVSQGKMHKTVKVRVQSKTYDKKINKDVLRRKDYLVHDEGNLCKEGDIVRIEAIPKISARKYFAIAEIKVDKGQQFALYETLAKKKVAEEEKSLVNEFINRRNELETTINKVEDLKILDRIVNKAKNSSETDRENLVKEINDIKQKYNIKSWPNVEPVLDLDISKASKDLSIIENRYTHIHKILETLMSPEYNDKKVEILTQVSKKDIEDLKPNVQKNLLRKFILDPKNECPVSL
ncbi:37S ribosomal protein S17, mitochondrial [[Candida] jaroonii]|uniref:37S ribosomal protein S17, mitochondrial n=1 Tax=[Candida] jaroonii TaxID=467808 RepID=A0ACA9YAA9_9ASCO|nr:37S ribosomal protein S17, mitochondrial [[Candida] jaroonii]